MNEFKNIIFIEFIMPKNYRPKNFSANFFIGVPGIMKTAVSEKLTSVLQKVPSGSAIFNRGEYNIHKRY